MSAQDRPGFPKHLLVEIIEKYLTATAIGPVQTVDSRASALSNGLEGLLAHCGYPGSKVEVSGDGAGAGGGIGAWIRDTRSLSTCRYTAPGCGECDDRDESFLGGVSQSGRGARETSAPGALTDAGGEFLHVIEDLMVLGHFCPNLLLGVHDRRVIAAECLADFG